MGQAERMLGTMNVSAKRWPGKPTPGQDEATEKLAPPKEEAYRRPGQNITAHLENEIR
jgi:hypothetical protein